MSFVRTTREEAFEPTGFPGYDIQMLAYPESATFINSRVAAGGHAADLHVHQADQIYYIVQGQMQVELGGRRHTAGTGSLVYIPAGLPHRNWNDGPGTEHHFEIIVPSARPGRPLLALVDSSARPEGQRDGYVTPPPSATPGGVTLQPLTRDSQAPKAAVSICDEPPQSPASGTHTHDFDQFYYVLRGALAVEVGGFAYDAPELALVILPAGIPHNSQVLGQAGASYLVVNVPVPQPPA
jgi:mannose-6-phosphate isomerase-like protein (cupin superfamily)